MEVGTLQMTHIFSGTPDQRVRISKAMIQAASDIAREEGVTLLGGETAEVDDMSLARHPSLAGLPQTQRRERT